MEPVAEPEQDPTPGDAKPTIFPLEQRLKLFAQRFKAQSREPDWASSVETTLTDGLITQQYTDTYSIERVECKTTLCLIVVEKENSLLYQDRKIKEAEWNHIVDNGIKAISDSPVAIVSMMMSDANEQKTAQKFQILLEKK